MIAAAQDGEHIVARAFFVELFEQHGFFFANFGPQKRVQQMLRAQIFDGLAGGALDGHRANQEFIFEGIETRKVSPSLAISKTVVPITGAWPITRMLAGRWASKNALTS